MTLKNLAGRASWIFEERDFDVDQIIGVKNIKVYDLNELGALAMADYDSEFQSKVRPGDLLIGADNFGYGHPHYPPMRAMRHLGITAVIAESFSPGYWRGEMSMGFPQIACPGVLDLVKRWDLIEVDFGAHVVRNLTSERSLPFEPFSQPEIELIAAGGLENYLRLNHVVSTQERSRRTEKAQTSQ